MERGTSFRAEAVTNPLAYHLELVGKEAQILFKGWQHKTCRHQTSYPLSPKEKEKNNHFWLLKTPLQGTLLTSCCVPLWLQQPT